MNEFGFQLGLIFTHYPVVKWLMVVSGFLLLFLSLYKLTVVQTVARNGRVDTRYRIPELSQSLRKPKIRIQLKTKPRTYTKSQKRLFGVLYKLQFMIFGVSLFILGLGLVTMAGGWLLGSAAVPDTVWSVLAVFAGMAFMLFGYLAVYYRDRGNPFKDA